MDERDEKSEPEESWAIDVFKPEDAAGVVALYRATYGDHFPKQEVYRAEWHVEQDRTHDSYRVVARTAEGMVIGTGATYRSTPSNPDLYESGGVMVLPEYGRQNVALEITRFVLKKVPYLFNIRQIWGECVCNHVFTQMYFIKDGGTACALEIDLLPDGSFKSQAERGLDKEGRVSALVISRNYQPTVQTIFLPPAYQDRILKIYEPFQLDHTFSEARGGFAEQNTAASVDIKETAGLCRMTVSQIGADFDGWLRAAEHEAMKAGVVVFQVIVPLNTPAVGKAVEYLKNGGYWLGGVMPGWFGADGLLMQKTLQEPDFDKIKVYSKPGKAILTWVQADYEARRR